MAIRTYNGFRTLEKLGAMTTYARVMTGVIGNIGIVSCFPPVYCGDSVASITGALMLLSRMRKMRIVNAGCGCWRRHRAPWPATLGRGRILVPYQARGRNCQARDC